MLEIKKIFRIKDFVNSLSEKEIEKKLFFYIIGFSVAFFVFFMAIAFPDVKEVIRITLEPLNKIAGPEKNIIIFNIIRDIIAMFVLMILIYFFSIFVISFIAQKILLLFKRKISFYKLVNIYCYILLVFVLSRAVLFLLSYIISLFLDNLSIHGDAKELIILLPVGIVKILLFVLYLYCVKISIKVVGLYPVH